MYRRLTIPLVILTITALRYKDKNIMDYKFYKTLLLLVHEGICKVLESATSTEHISMNNGFSYSFVLAGYNLSNLLTKRMDELLKFSNRDPTSDSAQLSSHISIALSS